MSNSIEEQQTPEGMWYHFWPDSGPTLTEKDCPCPWCDAKPEEISGGLKKSWISGLPEYNKVMKKPTPFITPVATVLYSNIFTPCKKYNKSGEYTIDVSMPVDEMDSIKNTIQTIQEEFLKDKVDDHTIHESKVSKITIKKPFFYTKAGDIGIKAKQYTKDLNSQPLTIPFEDIQGVTMPSLISEIPRGAKVKLTIYPKPYYIAKDNMIGLSFRINLIRALSDDIPFGTTGPSKTFSAKIDIDLISELERAKAVVQDIKSYESLQNSLNFLKLIVQSEKEIETGNVIEQGKMFDELEQKLFK